MVTFRLIEESEQHMLTYWYFVEGEEDKGHGVILVDIAKRRIKITEVAPEDYERDISPEELNEMAEAINEMEREAGGTDFVEMTTEPVHKITYGDHAVDYIGDCIRSGEAPAEGKVFWY